MPKKQTWTEEERNERKSAFEAYFTSLKEAEAARNMATEAEEKTHVVAKALLQKYGRGPWRAGGSLYVIAKTPKEEYCLKELPVDNTVI